MLVGLLWLDLNLVLLGSSVAAAEEEVAATNANPYTSGCLYRSLPGWNKKRVCNSDDPAEAASAGLCREPAIPQLEIRIFSFNWDTTYFEAWLLQIVLSELLDVPVTIESGVPEVFVSMYDREGRYDFGPTSDAIVASSFRNAAKYNQDCTLASRESDNYEPCAHHYPEVWNADQGWMQQGIDENALEFPYALGVVGHDGIYVTKQTVQQEPSILSYFGLQGQENRRKVAELFPRPFTWAEYCQDVSRNNCKEPDRAAKRAPTTTEEGQHYFVKGLYTGHFRHTEENNCENNPLNCTGHIAPYPCGWSSYAESQMYHLDIALKGGGKDPNMPHKGYHYTQLVELIKAAEATGSNLILEWWTPTETSGTLRGTDTELIKVAFPTTTQECLSNRHSLEDICSPDRATRVGDPIAACGEAAEALVQTVTIGLKEVVSQQDEAVRSPAYDVLKRFLITEFRLGEIFQLMRAANRTQRDATCQWAVENFDNFLLPLVPPSHPRTLQDSYHSVLSWIGISLGLLTCALVLLTAARVYHLRNRRVIVYAQIEFLYTLLLGGLMLATGATVLALPATAVSCVAADWLINTGYTLILVPLIIKVAAINKLNQAAKQMKRVTVERSLLWGATATISCTILIFLSIWTALDPASKTAEYSLTESKTEGGDSSAENPSFEDMFPPTTIVDVSYFCSSESSVWGFITVGWIAVLLICCTVLAVQTRKVRQEFNETQVLGLLIYSHFAIALMIMVTFFLSPVSKDSTMEKVRSILYCVDTLTTITVYFLPKVLPDSGVFQNFSSQFNVSRLNSEQAMSFNSQNGDGSVTGPFKRRTAATVGDDCFSDEDVALLVKRDQELVNQVLEESTLSEKSEETLRSLLSSLEQLRMDHAALIKEQIKDA